MSKERKAALSKIEEMRNRGEIKPILISDEVRPVFLELEIITYWLALTAEESAESSGDYRYYKELAANGELADTDPGAELAASYWESHYAKTIQQEFDKLSQDTRNILPEPSRIMAHLKNVFVASFPRISF